MNELRVESVLSGFQFIWQSPETLKQFVDAANNLSPESKDTKPPSWISQPRGSITEVTFVNDLLKYLAELGGGFYEDTKLIMPNTSTQAYNICRRLGHIEMDPFMQACVAELPDDAHFASVMRLFEDPGINACPVYFVAPPPPFRQLFF
uniref:Uncharacterized protein n=1 Tax=Globisporangium ultimum (strain ATCC 200006 / CBS 805.95 / DAOM BR144) TaxID=431595 RepID=K3X2D3_GLOUD